MLQSNAPVVRTFYVSTALRDKARFPHPSRFDYNLPATLNNVVGVCIRNYKFPKELLVNENNKFLYFVINGGELEGVVQVSKGDYDIEGILTELNAKFEIYGVELTFESQGDRVVITFADEFITQYIVFKSSSLLVSLGFDGDICLCREGVPPPNISSSTTTVFTTTAVAHRLYDVTTISDLVVRIDNVETIMSNDTITHRATMVLFSSEDPYYTLNQCAAQCIPLLQMQSRLQNLKLTLLNTKGELYDTITNDASFLIDFYCVA